MSTKLPTHSSIKILRLQEQLANEAFLKYLDFRVDVTLLNKLVLDLTDNYLTRVDPGSLHQSLFTLLGKQFTVELADTLSWLLAGNSDKLQAKQVIQPWTGFWQDEWSLTKVTAVWPGSLTIKDKKYYGAKISFLILSGYAAGQKFTKFMTSGYCQAHRAMFGFSKFINKNNPGRPHIYPLTHITELTNLAAYVYLESELCQKKQYFKQLDNTQKIIQENRSLLKKRLRQGFTCPKNYRKACHQCEFGYKTCSAACHKEDFVLQWCSFCNSQQVFDPEQSVVLCLRCLQTKA